MIPNQRGYATDPSTSSSSSTTSQSFPPPGFNSKQAKESIPKDKESQSGESKDKHVGESSSAVEHTREEDKTKLKELGTAKTAVAKEGEKKKEQKKLTIGQKIKKEVHHYWDGTKLLATEVRISMRLAIKMAAGYELTRREHRQVCDPGSWREVTMNLIADWNSPGCV